LVDGIAALGRFLRLVFRLGILRHGADGQ
jgi:hypothetical protein